MMVFRYDFGSVHWYAGGTVLVYLQGEGLSSRARETLSRAFSYDECLDFSIWAKNERL
jgi:hypothetical protein